MIPRIYIDRLLDGRFTARISLRCGDCQEWMEFFGLPADIEDRNGATVSSDRKEVRLAFGTKETLYAHLERAIQQVDADLLLTELPPVNVISIEEEKRKCKKTG